MVLSTFAHPATHEILDVTIGQGEDAETIGVTETHPFWSVQDQAFVPVGHLVAGSQVLTADEQTKTITSILPRPGPAQQVYNLEVNGEHVYYVGQQQLLVHNHGCKTIGLGKNDFLDELGDDVLLARDGGWTKAQLTTVDSNHFSQFADAFHDVINSGAQIRFNLRGFESNGALNLNKMWTEVGGISSIAARKKRLVTEWELFRVLKNPDALSRTTFVFGDEVVSGKNIDDVYELLLRLQAGN